jgi:hypothetical protein
MSGVELGAEFGRGGGEIEKRQGHQTNVVAQWNA